MANIPVKWFKRGMSGAPELSANIENAGQILPLLDAVLVDGFGLVTVDSLAVASNVATCTRSAGVTFLVHQVIEIAGASPSSLNGQWRVTSVDPATKTWTFATSGINDCTATGTITCKTPGLGWERVFTGTNKAVYRSQHEDSPRSYYRVDDSQTATATGYNGARFRAYESMSDVDTGANEWTLNDNSGAWLARAHYVHWVVIGDERTFHGFWGTRYNTLGPQMTYQGFGDYVSFTPGDPYNEFFCLTNCFKGSATNLGLEHNCSVFNATAPYITGSGYYGPARNFRGLHRSVDGTLGVWSIGGMLQVNDASGYGGPTYPSPVDNGMMVTDVLIRQFYDALKWPVRGRLRGAYWILASQPFTAAEPITAEVDNIIGLEGRKCFIICPTEYIPAMSSHQGLRVAVDTTGPWM